MKESMQIVFGLLGGLAVFIFGMNLMSECLQKAAGEKMKNILSMLTRNPVMGVLAGALVTAVLQSSSATTVMAIGFVSAGLMSLPQAISIIFGANIGTTMTAQIIAFKISDYIYVFIFVGFIISFICKSEKVKNIGQTIFAFGLLFLGIETMGDVMKPLASSPVFTDMIAQVGDVPVLGVAVGTLMTLVVQILLGDNIGTTITALLASVGQSKDAKRTALAHSIFNISGALLFIWFVKPYAALIQYLSPKGAEVEVIARQIANAHTVFNISMTLIWVGLIGVMVKIVMKIIPDGKKELVDPSMPVYLDKNVIGQPAAALQLAAKEVLHSLNGEIIDYLAELFSAGVLTEGQASQTAKLMYVLSDVDRMGSLSVELSEAIQDKTEKKYSYSGDAMNELQKGLELILKMQS